MDRKSVQSLKLRQNFCKKTKALKDAVHNIHVHTVKTKGELKIRQRNSQYCAMAMAGHNEEAGVIIPPVAVDQAETRTEGLVRREVFKWRRRG